MNPPNLLMGKPYSFLKNKERPVSGQNSRKVNKESRKITKNAPLSKPQNSIVQIVEPRITYTVPQRVIHITPQDFKDVVQQLTGIEKPTGISQVSPTASLVSTKRTSPEKKERPSWSNGDDGMTRMLDNGVQMNQFPGILMPEAAILPPLPYENFLQPELPQMQYNNFLPPVLPQMQYNNNSLPPVLPQMQYNNNFLPPTLPQMQYNNNFLPPTLPQRQYNNFLPPPLPQRQYNNFLPAANVMPLPLTTSEIFSPVNLPPIPSETFLRNTWQQKPSDIFSPVTLPQSDIFSPVTLPPTQPDNLLPDNWQPSDILSQPVDNFSPVRLPPTQPDNLLPDNWQPSDILLADTWQPPDNFSPVRLPPTQSDICSPSNILSADTWEPSDILSPTSTQSDTFSTDPWQLIQSDIYSPVALPQTPSDTWLSSDTFAPETLQPEPYEVFSDGFRPENNIFAKPPEFLPAGVVPPQMPSNRFNSFIYN
ncbi:unnamed protein product [Lathyrus oleraceus]